MSVAHVGSSGKACSLDAAVRSRQYRRPSMQEKAVRKGEA